MVGIGSILFTESDLNVKYCDAYLVVSKIKPFMQLMYDFTERVHLIHVFVNFHLYRKSQVILFEKKIEQSILFYWVLFSPILFQQQLNSQSNMYFFNHRISKRFKLSLPVKEKIQRRQVCLITIYCEIYQTINHHLNKMVTWVTSLT